MKEFKKDFSKYYSDVVSKIDTTQLMKTGMGAFYHLPDCMKWGMYVDFFDSVQIRIEEVVVNEGFMYAINWKTGEPLFKTRQDARQEALKQAINLYENQLLKMKE